MPLVQYSANWRVSKRPPQRGKPKFSPRESANTSPPGLMSSVWLEDSSGRDSPIVPPALARATQSAVSHPYVQHPSPCSHGATSKYGHHFQVHPTPAACL